ncbi:MAG: hypothetical protein HYZ16_06675 [Bacteroidetes bacterium]|nr:hypothetical protein [Bacteroidota bacterium]
MKPELIPDILFGCIVERHGRFHYTFKISLSTSPAYGNEQNEVMICPDHVIVNNVCFPGRDVDMSFMDTVMLNRKSMLIVRDTEFGFVCGDLYKVPFGRGNAVKIPNSMALELLSSYIGPEYDLGQA